MSARMRHLKCPSSQYPVLKVHALRLIRSDRAARQGDILPDRRGAVGGNLGVHISYIIWDPTNVCQPLTTARRASLYIRQSHG